MIIAIINVVVMLFFPLPKFSSDTRAIVSDCCAVLGRLAVYVVAHVGTYVGADKGGAGARATLLRVAWASAAAVMVAGGRYRKGDDGLLRVSLAAQAGPFEGAVTAFADAPENCRRDVSDLVVFLLGVFRLAALTGVVLHDPYLYAQIFSGYLGIFCNVECQCTGSAATRVALETFKWCLWSCCNFDGTN